MDQIFKNGSYSVCDSSSLYLPNLTMSGGPDGTITNVEVSPKEGLLEKQHLTYAIGFDVCPYCASDRNNIIHREGEYVVPDGATKGLEYSFALGLCLNCSYWATVIYGYHPHSRSGEEVEILASSIIQDFDDSLPEGFEVEFAQYLKKNPDALHNIDPKSLELLVAEVLRANYKQSEVIHVGKPFDRGVDILMIDTHKRRWLVQVKQTRSPNTYNLPAAPLMELVGAMAPGGDLKGIFVTTRRGFTRESKLYADSITKRGLYIKMVDKGKLLRMTEAMIPKYPWENFIEHYAPGLGSVFQHKTQQYELF